MEKGEGALEGGGIKGDPAAVPSHIDNHSRSPGSTCPCLCMYKQPPTLCYHVQGLLSGDDLNPPILGVEGF